jgi:hypothetical protein
MADAVCKPGVSAAAAAGVFAAEAASGSAKTANMSALPDDPDHFLAFAAGSGEKLRASGALGS